MSQQIVVQNLEVRNNEAEERFEVTLGHQLGLIDYRIKGNVIAFTHTEVPESYEGQGIAQKMAHAALEFAKENNYQIVPLCPFVAHYVEKHPEYQGMVAR